MKKSRYNVIFQYKTAYILFNTKTQKLILLTNEFLDFFDSVKDVESLPEDYKTALKSIGAIVPDDYDEYTEITKSLESVDNDDTMFHVIVNPTLNCNFNCWYCYENHGNKMTMNPQLLHRTKLLLYKKAIEEQFRVIKLSFFGGEPLLQYKGVIVPLLQYLSELKNSCDFSTIVHITTNGYLLNKERIHELKVLGVNSFQITLDGNEDKHNQVRFISNNVGSYATIIRNIELICQSEMYIILRINYTASNYNSLKDVFHHFGKFDSKYKQFIVISLNQVWQDIGNLSDDEIESLYESANDAGLTLLSELNEGRFQYACYADKRNQAVINYNGLVYKCNARDFTPESAEGILNDIGEIEWNERFHKRMSIRFKNPACEQCYMLPMCNGGCRQYALEHEGQRHCILDFDENKKLRMIKSLIFSRNVSSSKIDKNILENS